MTAPSLAAPWSSWAPQFRSVLRIVAAFTFMARVRGAWTRNGKTGGIEA